MDGALKQRQMLALIPCAPQIVGTDYSKDGANLRLNHVAEVLESARIYGQAQILINSGRDTTEPKTPEEILSTLKLMLKNLSYPGEEVLAQIQQRDFSPHSTGILILVQSRPGMTILPAPEAESEENEGE